MDDQQFVVINFLIMCYFSKGNGEIAAIYTAKWPTETALHETTWLSFYTYVGAGLNIIEAS